MDSLSQFAVSDKPLRVLQVNKFHFLNGGSELVYLGLSDLLRERGHQVGHFSMKDPRNVPSRYEDYFIESVQYDTGRPLASVRNAARILYSRDARQKISRLLAEETFDLVHLHNFYHQITPSILPEIKKHGIPIVFTTHDLKIACPNYRMLAHDGVCERCKGERYYNCFVHKCTKNSAAASFVNMAEMYFHHLRGYYDLIDCFIAPSAFYRDLFVRFGFPPDRFVHIPYCIHVDQFEPHYAPGKYLLYLGRLAFEKGLGTLVEAMKELPDVALKVAGTGSFEKDIERSVAENGLANIELLGHKGTEEVKELLRDCIAVVLPSEWYEATGLCLIEAYAAGKPVIAARIGGIPEVISEGKTGFLFDPGDARDLAEKIRLLVSDTDRAVEMGRAGRTLAVEEYDRPQFYTRMMEVYESVITEARPKEVPPAIEAVPAVPVHRPLSVLQVNKFHWDSGGSESYYLGLSDLLRAHGHTVGFFSMNDERNHETPYSKYFISNINYTNPGGTFEKGRLAIRTLYSFEARRKMRALLDEHRFRIAHLHNVYHQLTMSIIPELKNRDITVVYTLHDLKPLCGNYRMLTHDGICERCMQGRFFNCALHRCMKGSLMASAITAAEMYSHHFLGYYDMVDLYICSSEFYRQKMIEFGFPPEKTCTVPNFVRVDQFEPNFEPGDYLLYFGRLSHEKGLLTLLSAMKALPDLPLKVAGRGPFDSEVERVIREDKLDNVTLLGFRSGSALRDLIRNSKAVVLPSEWYENGPMSLVESCAYGKPIIGSNIAGVAEMVRHNETGVTFESGNVDSLVDAIRSIISDRERLTEMGRAGRRLAEQEYDAPVHYERIMDVYEKVLA